MMGPPASPPSQHTQSGEGSINDTSKEQEQVYLSKTVKAFFYQRHRWVKM